MKSIKDSIDLKRFGIESSKKEKCTVCDYGTVITITVNGKETSQCRYCKDMQLAKDLDLPTTKEESEKKKTQAKAKHFSKIPDDLQHVKLNDYKTGNYTVIENGKKVDKQQEAKQIAIKFITEFDKEKSFVMSGEPGIGKSHIAVAIAKALQNDYSVLFIKSTDLLGLIKESYSGADYSERDIFNICHQVDLLVLDDIGAEYDKSQNNESWASDILFKVLDSRLGKSTVITTNYSETQLENKFGMNGKRIVSRMNDKAEKIRIFGKDMRKSD